MKFSAPRTEQESTRANLCGKIAMDLYLLDNLFFRKAFPSSLHLLLTLKVIKVARTFVRLWKVERFFLH